MSECERYMFDYFTRMWDGKRKMEVPGIASRFNCYFTSQKSSNATAAAKYHSKMVNLFMSSDPTYSFFFPNDMVKLAEGCQLIEHNILCDIQSGKIVVPKFPKLVKKTLIIDDKSKLIVFPTTEESDEEEITATDRCPDKEAQMLSKSTVNSKPAQSKMEFILAEILRNQVESKQLGEKNSARIDEIVARNAATTSLEANKSIPKQLNFDEIFRSINGPGPNQSMFSTYMPSPKSMVSDYHFQYFFICSFSNLINWVQTYVKSTNIVLPYLNELTILQTHMHISLDVTHGLYVFLKNCLLQFDRIISEIIDGIFKDHSSHCSGDKLLYIAQQIDNVCFSITIILVHKNKLQAYFKHSRSLLISRAGILIKMIKKGIRPSSLKFPPEIICSFILQTAYNTFLKCFFTIHDMKSLYWLSNFRYNNYLGSSIHCFLGSQSRQSRSKQHFCHAILHYLGIFHQCRQPVLYEAMAFDLWLWNLIPIVFVSCSIFEMRSIEDNFIASTHPNMNRKGRYRKKGRTTILARIESSSYASSKLCSNTRRAIRKRDICKRPDGNLTKFIEKASGKVFHDLLMLINKSLKIKTEGWFTVICEYGSSVSDLTSYDAISFMYGDAVVELQGITMFMKDFIKNRIYKNKHFEISLQSQSFIKSTRIFPTNGIQSENELANFSPLMCLKFWKMRKGIRNSLDKALTSQSIKKHMRKEFGFIINDSYRIVLPSICDMSRKRLGSIVWPLLIDIGLCPMFASFVIKRLSITKKYAASIRDILDNSKKMADNFDPDKPFGCKCRKIQTLGEKIGSSHGHFWIKNDDITDLNVKNIIALAGNSRPNEDSADIKEKVVQAISDLLKITSTNSDCNTEDFIKYFFNVQFLACKTGRSFFTEDQIRHCSKLIEGCIIAYLDKNKNSNIIVCPFLFWLKLKLSFVDDIAHFSTINHIQEKDILNNWIIWYKEVFKSRIPLARRSWAIAGNASVLFKDKDTYESSDNYDDIRVRILISVFHHGKVLPFRPALKVCNAALFACMKTKSHKGMAMKRCQDLVDDVSKKTAVLGMVYGKDSQFVVFQYDIENFFTNVLSSFVKDALRFFLLDNENILEGFWVHKKNRKFVFHTKPKLEENFYFISKSQIWELVIFDLDNCYFMLGQHTLIKQNKGLSIGGQLSSALAIMLANYAEHKTLSELFTGNILRNQEGLLIIDGLRITDDGLIFVVINRCVQGEDFAFQVISAFIAKFEQFTGHSLNIILAKQSNEYQIFENSVINLNSKVVVMFHVKNFQSLLQTGVQKIKKGVHPISACSTLIKVNTLMQTFMRIKHGSTFDIFCLLSSLQFIFEVNTGFNWDPIWTKHAVYKLMFHARFSGEIWHFLNRVLVSKGYNNNVFILQWISQLSSTIENYFVQIRGI